MLVARQQIELRLAHEDKKGTPVPAPELASSSTWLGAAGAAAAILLLSLAWTVLN